MAGVTKNDHYIVFLTSDDQGLTDDNGWMLQNEYAQILDRDRPDDYALLFNQQLPIFLMKICLLANINYPLDHSINFPIALTLRNFI